MEQVRADGTRYTVIHFTFEMVVPPSSQEGPPVKQWRIACMPNMTEFHQTMYHPHYERTNSKQAVTCQQCIKTPVFTNAKD